MLDWVLLAAVLGVAGYLAYTHQAQVRAIVQMVEVTLAPCANPITYSIGAVDQRFGISEPALLVDLGKAEAIWEESSGKNLFEYREAGGDVTVNLVYDSRQAATDTLRAAGVQLNKSKGSYNALKTMYDTISLQVASEQSIYASRVAAYKRAEDAYNAEVEEWNKKGGAPKAVYERLQAEQVALAKTFVEIRSFESAMNAHIDTLNALATTLNQLIVQLNINVTQYNRAGASLGEFEEGLYRLSEGVQTIDVYEYSNRVQLIRVLAHEMGHALSLEHVPDQEAIMYKINQSRSLTATASDVSELNRVCSSGR